MFLADTPKSVRWEWMISRRRLQASGPKKRPLRIASADVIRQVCNWEEAHGEG
jgi:hypothetical protein